jgi:hypothetical protein
MNITTLTLNKSKGGAINCRDLIISAAVFVSLKGEVRLSILHSKLKMLCRIIRTLLAT